MSKIYIAVGKNFWGIGHNPEKAKKNFRRAGGSGKVSVGLLPAGASDVRVNEVTGEITWAGAGREIEWLTKAAHAMAS